MVLLGIGEGDKVVRERKKPSKEEGKLKLDSGDHDSFDENCFEKGSSHGDSSNVSINIRVYRIPLDNYLDDFKDKAPVQQLYNVAINRKLPNRFKSTLDPKELRWWGKRYALKHPARWDIKISKEDDCVLLLSWTYLGIYIRYFEFRMRLPFTNFQKRVFNYFWLAYGQILWNSWRLLMGI